MRQKHSQADPGRKTILATFYFGSNKLEHFEFYFEICYEYTHFDLVLGIFCKQASLFLPAPSRQSRMSPNQTPSALPR